MASVNFTHALKRFYPDLGQMDIDVKTVSQLLKEVEDRFPGITSYLLDDQGRLRQHVNIFVDGKLISDKTHFTDALTGNSEVYIMQALSGG